jgi:hypothetical protein
LSNLAALITFTSLAQFASARVSTVNNAEDRAGLPAGVLSAVRLDVIPILGSNPVTFAASARLGVGPAYVGSGSDLYVFHRDGTNWLAHSFVFHSTNNTVEVNGLTNAVTFAVVQTPFVPLRIVSGTNGNSFSYEAVPGWLHTVESTTNFVTWQSIGAFQATEPSTISVPFQTISGNFFYRLRLELP